MTETNHFGIPSMENTNMAMCYPVLSCLCSFSIRARRLACGKRLDRWLGPGLPFCAWTESWLRGSPSLCFFYMLKYSPLNIISTILYNHQSTRVVFFFSFHASTQKNITGNILEQIHVEKIWKDWRRSWAAITILHLRPLQYKDYNCKYYTFISQQKK